MRVSFFFCLATIASATQAAMLDYNVRKIISAFRTPHDDLRILCAHRGLRWNGTTENSPDSYFRASQNGIECIETDIHLSLDGKLPMIHDGGLGRETNVGELNNKAAYNPYTGKGFNPKVNEVNYTGYIKGLNLRDEQGRTRLEKVPTLPDMIKSIHDSGANVVLQLDFKDQAAIEPAYWQIKNLTNKAGVPAVEWCIFKLQSVWYPTSSDFERLEWVQDAFKTFGTLAYIPVFDPSYEGVINQLQTMKAFDSTNYTISWEIELRSTNGTIQNLLDYAQGRHSKIKTAGTFYAIGDFIKPEHKHMFDTANHTLPRDIRVNNTVYTFQDNKAPQLLDSQLFPNSSVDGHDHRSDLAWIYGSNYNWLIADTSDEIAHRLHQKGLRNLTHMLQDGAHIPKESNGWYTRHSRDWTDV